MLSIPAIKIASTLLGLHVVAAVLCNHAPVRIIAIDFEIVHSYHVKCDMCHVTSNCDFIGRSYTLPGDKRMRRYSPDPFSLSA